MLRSNRKIPPPIIRGGGFILACPLLLKLPPRGGGGPLEGVRVPLASPGCSPEVLQEVEINLQPKPNNMETFAHELDPEVIP